MGQPEQARAAIPDRRENIAEHNRVPGYGERIWAWLIGALRTETADA